MNANLLASIVASLWEWERVSAITVTFIGRCNGVSLLLAHQLTFGIVP